MPRALDSIRGRVEVPYHMEGCLVVPVRGCLLRATGRVRLLASRPAVDGLRLRDNGVAVFQTHGAR